MTAAWIAGGLLAFLWGFWALYVLVMGLYRASLDKRLTPATKFLGLPWVAIGFLVDVFAQLTVAALIFWEWPRLRFEMRAFARWNVTVRLPVIAGEWLVTDRLQRHVLMPTSAWRTRLAIYVCDHILDPVDPTGNHC